MIPSGTVTFLFTDVEGSTRLWATGEDAMSASLQLHDAVLNELIGRHGGYVFSTAGDSFAAAFARSSDAARAAEEAQDRLSSTAWPGPELRVRMGLHLGEAEERQGDYFGPAVNTAARVQSVAHGGQVLLTDAVRTTAGLRSVTDLGRHWLRDVPEPQQLFQLGDRPFPPPPTKDLARSNLPARPTRFVGREEDIATCRRLLTTCRLVTLTGVGGAGKTRTAMAVGERELAAWRDGVWFCDLTAIRNGADLPETVARALGLSLGQGDPTTQIVAYLEDKSALIIVDNCEHLVAACAELADRLLAAPGRSVLLATSREALNVEGERLVVLGPFPSDGEASPAVTLFVDRATAVAPSFEATPSSLQPVAALCARLDGIPLAIELAAARVTVLTVPELLAGLDERFTLLSSVRRGQRHRTLEATLDWSYDLLAEEQRRIMRALGVFEGGFDVDAVCGVCDVSRVVALEVLETLVAKSMVARQAPGRSARFGLLETVKAYAERQLAETGEADEVRDRHLAYFHTRATPYGRTVAGEIRLAARLQPDSRNLTAAFEWAAKTDRWTLAGETMLGAHLAYEAGAAAEARALIERAIPELESDPELVAYLRSALLFIFSWLDDWASYVSTARLMQQSETPAARAYGFLAIAASTAPVDGTRAERLLAHAADQQRTAHDADPGLNTSLVGAWVHHVLASTSGYRGDYGASLHHTAEFFAIDRANDYYTLVTIWMRQLAAVCEIASGNPAVAIVAMEALEGEGFGADDGREARTLAELELGAVEKARESIRSYAERAATGRIMTQASDGALLLAALAATEGDDDRAVELLLHMGLGSQPATIVYGSYLAHRLGVSSERAERLAAALHYGFGSDEGPTGTLMALRAVREELRRRGW